MNRALRLLAVGCVVTGVCRVCAQVPLASPNLVFDDAGGIRIIAAASDGGYLIAGDFRSVHGAGRAGFAKVTSNGSVVTAFDPAPDRAIKAIAVAGTSAFVIGDFTAVAGVSYHLHDGRARTLMEAIGWHGGEADASRIRFEAMSKDERAAVLAFLNSL